MSLDSDPIDQAFPEEVASTAYGGGDPIDEAFSETPKTAVGRAEAAGSNILNQLHEAGSGLTRSIVGGYKGLISLLSGGDLNAAADAVTRETSRAYRAPEVARPRLPGGLVPQEIGGGAFGESVPQGLDAAAEASAGSPALATALKVAPVALGGLAPRPASLEAAAPSTTAEIQSALNQAASGKSMGAASTAVDIAAASPELQKAIANTVRKTGGAVNPDVLTRRVEADSLPVRMNLTEGQATQDPSIISNEMNLRGKHKELADAYNQQNGQLIDNLRAIREGTGPDVFSTNAVEHGDTLIDAYKQKAAAADAVTDAKYQALRDAAGGEFPVDATALVNNASQALHAKLLYDHAPLAVMNTLNRLAANNSMTFENFESLRTNLARIQRSATDGNERAAAGVIRDAMENLPLQAGAQELKPLADDARASAKAQFQALEADPAYKAAVNDSVTPDKFVSKYIIGGSRDQVATMRQNFADNDRATQTMGVAALDHLRDQARVDSMGNGNFAAASFNKHLDALRPKLHDLLPPEQANNLDTLGKVARYTTAQPKGSFVNNSNTLVGALSGMAAHGVEHSANVVAKGLPVGTLVRKAMEKKSAANEVKRALDPASGLENLKERP